MNQITSFYCPCHAEHMTDFQYAVLICWTRQHTVQKRKKLWTLDWVRRCMQFRSNMSEVSGKTWLLCDALQCSISFLLLNLFLQMSKHVMFTSLSVMVLSVGRACSLLWQIFVWFLNRIWQRSDCVRWIYRRFQLCHLSGKNKYGNCHP